MYISRETAQEIVEEIGREIGEHINLMDERGYIIASTDAARIGNLHEAEYAPLHFLLNFLLDRRCNRSIIARRCNSY